MEENINQKIMIKTFIAYSRNKKWTDLLGMSATKKLSIQKSCHCSVNMMRTK